MFLKYNCSVAYSVKGRVVCFLLNLERDVKIFEKKKNELLQQTLNNLFYDFLYGITLSVIFFINAI